MAGGPPAFDAFLDLVSLLLNLTILAPRGAVRLTTGPRRNAAILGGWRGPSDPLPLRDGKFLRATILLYLDQTQEGERLKIQESSYQCQADALGERWIVRYDYLRYPPSPYPGAHLQIRGELAEPCLPPERPLSRVHFPVGRVSLEAVIRLLADQFGVPTNEPSAVWRPVLAESERAFLEIAHRPLSGPEA
jgi:hypothetical protein